MRYFCCAILLIVCALSLYAHCNNVSKSAPDKSLQNAERISELYLMVADLMTQFEQNQMSHYSKFFDKTLMSEVHEMFRRLYRYAANETQGNQWEKVAVRCLKLYVIHMFASQANVLFEYRAQYHRLSSSEPSTLQMASLAQVKKYIMRYLNEEFRYTLVDDSVFLYELMYFIRLPILIKYLNVSPYFVIRLENDRERRRFFNGFCEPTTTENVGGSSSYCFLTPFSPAKNFAEEIKIFHRAQTNVLEFLIEHSCDTDLNKFVPNHVIAYLNETLEHVLMNFSTESVNSSTITILACLRGAALFKIFDNYLQREHNRLVCHPAFDDYRAENNPMIEAITDVQNQLQSFYKCLVKILLWTQASSIYCSTMKAFNEALQRLNLIVGYTSRSDTAIAMVEDDVTSPNAFNMAP